jgi:hypothetical protein
MTRSIKAGHHVKSADGTLYTVTYVGPQYDAARGGYSTEEYAELLPREYGGDSITLPVSELTRVTDPRSRRPPIEGMPEQRPICQWCGVKLTPWTRTHEEGVGNARRMVKREFGGWNGYPTHEPLFHSTGCAIKFATACHRAGYRRTT